ncbi:MAG: hypothetical protein JW958_14645 [Candidatus Eisenbacteria bacterium]|nr:hypothetical protein [Candidatus Eisenbacteria bacterium]
MNHTPPALPRRVRKTVRVGVTGHRGLSSTDRAEIKVRTFEILRRIRKAVEGCDPLPGCPELFEKEILATVVSPLADGADQIVAEIALDLGYELQSPLPFPADEYRKDFDASPEALARFRSLIARATAVLELCGTRENAGAAYEAVGRVVLEHADILLAVWDGGDPEGVGGTGQIVREALAARIPVIVVSPDDPGVFHLRISTRANEVTECPPGELEERLLDILFPARDGGSSSAYPEEHYRKQQKEYASFCAEKEIGKRWGRRLIIGRAWGAAWGRFTAPFREGVWREPEPAVLPDQPQNKRGDIDRYRAFLAGHYSWASRLAIHYADLYRSSFLMNYLLGAAAVTLVLLANFIHSHEVLFLLLELVCIATILLVQRVGRRRRWHLKAVDYRILAELFRQMRYLGPLATSIPFTRLPAHARIQGDLTGTWMNWHFRSVLREAGMVSVSLTSDYRRACREMLYREWLEPQKLYHSSIRKNHERLRACLERGGAALFLVTLVACVFHLIAHPVSRALHVELYRFLLPLLTILAASLPAWAAAFHGIESQGELERLTGRSESMEYRLEELLNGFPPPGEGDEAPSYADLLQWAREAAEEMLQEVIDWRVFYRAHGIPTA